jgi:hypothetical protein
MAIAVTLIDWIKLSLNKLAPSLQLISDTTFYALYKLYLHSIS